MIYLDVIPDEAHLSIALETLGIALFGLVAHELDVEDKISIVYIDQVYRLLNNCKQTLDLHNPPHKVLQVSCLYGCSLILGLVAALRRGVFSSADFRCACAFQFFFFFFN